MKVIKKFFFIFFFLLILTQETFANKISYIDVDYIVKNSDKAVAVSDFPLPDSPTKAILSPCLKEKLTPSTAFTTPSGVS